ncbi:MAG: T9SS type A sorting domain-containing protein [Ignavibacteria bacterium]|nr:T9SS type A sorting domain-containing protein [Ignavibacteria bacterium]
MCRIIFFLFCFFFAIVYPSRLLSQLQQNNIIINEWYLNPALAEGKEYVELIVVKDHADLRGVRLSDVSVKGGSGALAEGHLTFPQLSFLADIPQWTIIVCVLEAPVVNTNIFTQDTDVSDGRLTLFSKALDGGILDTIGRMDLSTAENIVLLANGSDTAKTIDYVATGNNNSLANFPDATWISNLSTGIGTRVTYFTNSAGNGLVNDNAFVGWNANITATLKTPGYSNPGQILPVVNFPPSITELWRGPFVPFSNNVDTIYCRATDNGGIASATINYTINGGSSYFEDMTLVSGNNHDGVYRGIIPAIAHSNGNRIDYFVRIVDNNPSPLYIDSDNFGYFAGISPMSTEGIKQHNGIGELKYQGYAARVRGTATVNSSTFSLSEFDVFLEDSVGGINIFFPEPLTQIAEGNAYTIVGTLSTKNGRALLTSPNLLVTQSVSPTTILPYVLTIGEYLANPEFYESTLLRFQSCQKTNGAWPSSGNDAQLTITDGTGNITLYLDGNTNVGNYSEPDYPVNFSGIAYQNDDTSPYFDNYGILLRGISDVSVGEVNTPPVIESVSRTIGVPTMGQTNTVTAEITDNSEVSLAYLVYIINNIQRDSVQMFEIAKEIVAGKKKTTLSGTLPGTINQNGNRVRILVHAKDDGVPPLSGFSEEQKYIAGVTAISPTRLKSTDNEGNLLYEGYTVRVRGVATVGDSVFSFSDVDIYVQDDSGGINIHNEGGIGVVDFNKGKGYEITGTLTHFQGTARLTTPFFSADTANINKIITPKTLLLSQWYETPELYEGMLITIQQCMYIDGNWPFDPIDVDIYLTTPEFFPLSCFLDGDADFYSFEQPTWPVDLTGIAIQRDAEFPFNENYWIQPRQMTDLIEVVPNTPPEPFDIIEPEDNTQFTFNDGSDEFQMSWVAANDPENNTVRYKIVFATDSLFMHRIDTMIAPRGGLDTLAILTGIKAQVIINKLQSQKVSTVFWKVYANDGTFSTPSNQMFRLKLQVNNSFPSTFNLNAPLDGTPFPITDSGGVPAITFMWENAYDLDESDGVLYYLLLSETPAFNDFSVYMPLLTNGDSTSNNNFLTVPSINLYNKYLASGRDSVRLYWIARVMDDNYFYAHTTASADTFQILIHTIPVGWNNQNDVIINEFIFNPTLAEGKEFIELLVAKDGVSDLRGYRLSDVDSKGGNGENAEGHLDFPNEDYLFNLPFSTRIVCVLSTPVDNPNILTQDLDPSDSVLVLFSKAIPGGVLDTIGNLNIEKHDNIELLRGTLSDAATIDFIAAGNNSTQGNFPDALWDSNFDTLSSGKVTYFTNSQNVGLLNDYPDIGWKLNQPTNKKSPGLLNPTQVCGTIGDTPPLLVSHNRIPFIPQHFSQDTILFTFADNIAIDTAILYVSINDGGYEPYDFVRVNSDSIVELWAGVIRKQVNLSGTKIDYYAEAVDNNGLLFSTQKYGYFPGVHQLDYETIRAVDTNGIALHLNYAVRVQGTATVSDHTFALNRLDAYVQDASGGINLFVPQSQGGDTIHITEGLPYTIEGTLIQFRGKLELSTPGFRAIQEGTPIPIAPQHLTIADWLEQPEFYEGSLVRFSNVFKDSGTWPLPGSFATIAINDSTAGGVMFIDNDTDLDNVPEPQYPITVTGIASQYATTTPPYIFGYQVVPRRRADIISAGAPTGFDLLLPADSSRIQFLKANDSIRFLWNESTDPNNDTLRYKIIFASDNDFTMILDTSVSRQKGLSASYQLYGSKAASLLRKIGTLSNPPDSAQIFWKAIVSDGGNVISSNQERTVNLIVQNKPPKPFTLMLPANNAREVMDTSQLQMKWKKAIDNDATDTVFYYILFCENKGFTDTTTYSPNISGNIITYLKDTSYTMQRLKLRQKYLLSRDSVLVYWIVRAQDIFGVGHLVVSDTFRLMLKRTSTGIEPIVSSVPKEFYLAQNYPNPFNPTTEMEFGLPKESFVSLKIYNVLGKEVATLVSEILAAGRFRIEWNANDFPSGMYFYRFSAESSNGITFVKTRKLVFVK